MNLYLDIETIPSQRGDIKQEIAKTISHPKNISKAETIEKWNEEKKPAAIDAKLRETALGGTFGEIICICWAIDDGVIRTAYRHESEAELLSDFYSVLNAELPDVVTPIKWVGHNITGFDLRFIWQRSVINQVMPMINLHQDAKPWSQNVYDTMYEWAGLQGKDKSLDKICRAMGFDGKGDLDGSKVYDAWLAGEHDKIKEYCADDVEKVRKLHSMMNFEG